MKKRNVNRKIILLVLTGMLLGYGVAGVVFADHVTGVPHYHNDSTTRSVAENTPAGKNIGNQVSAHSTGAYYRYVLGGTDAGSFDIKSNNGQLKTKAALDYETKSSYTVTVTVQSGTLSPASDAVSGPIISSWRDRDSITVTINVTDVEWGFHEGDSTTREIAENTAAGVDIDSPVTSEQGDTYNYAVFGTDSSSFGIDSSTGQLKTKAALDYETKSSYAVTVAIQKQIHGPRRTYWISEDSIAVTINVTNVIEPVPVFNVEGDVVDLYIAENTAADVNIGDPVDATDEDGDTLTYSISGVEVDRVSIDSSTGQLKTKAALDYEDSPAFAVLVTVSDSTHSVSIAARINITNVNEAPTFSSDTLTRSFPTKLAQTSNFDDPVTATDPDITDSNSDANPETDADDSLTYSLSGTNASVFSIDSATGQLSTAALLDEDGNSSYQVTVTASDGSLSGSVAVTINQVPWERPTTSTADAAPTISSIEISQLVSLLTMDKVIINEIFNGSNDANDWLEFRNISDTAIDFTGWQLSIRSESGMNSVMFPKGTMLPVGEVLLLVNTDPSSPENPLAVPDDGSIHYVVDDTFNLPQMDFALILQSSDGGYEDSVGNYFPNRAMKPETAAPLTPDIAWYRAKPAVIGYQVEAWTESGYRFGRGYDHGTPEAIALGSPGHLHSIPGDLNDDGVVNIQDLVLVASAFGQTGGIADLNSDGTVNIRDLVMVASGFGGAAAPSAKTLHASHVQHWLKLAQREVGGNTNSRLSRFGDRSYKEGIGDHAYQKGIEVLEQLLATLIPKSSALLPNYPNPFNPETWIPYRLSKSADVQITINDARGSVVRLLDMGHRSAGMYQTRTRAAYWDGKNDVGESVASGIYFYTLTAGDFTTTRKMLILK